MPIVVCPRCNKRLESDIYDDDGNITAPSHMKTGLTRWCEPPIGPEGDPEPEEVRGDRATPGRRRKAPWRRPGGTGPEAGGSRRAAAARIEAALRERAQRSARAFAEEIERRRGGA